METYKKATKKAAKKAVKKRATKKVAEKPVKAPVEDKGVDTYVEPSKPVETPSEVSKGYKARPKALASVDNRKVPSSYAKSRSNKRQPNIIG
tara:strand:- start:506 stop:781 length:276 start_codon:yes stop_codon:yes gene_type:complete